MGYSTELLTANKEQKMMYGELSDFPANGFGLTSARTGVTVFFEPVQVQRHLVDGEVMYVDYEPLGGPSSLEGWRVRLFND